MANVIEPTLRFHESGIVGAGPALWYGSDAPNATGAFLRAPAGSRYFQKIGSGGIWHEKRASSGLANDWRAVSGSIYQTVAYTDFTDGGAAVGTKTLTGTIPVGATVKRAYILALTGFTGDTSAVINIGDGTDVDRYNTGNPSIYTTAAGETDLGVVSGTAYHTAAKSIVLTATSGSDWTAVAAGRMTVVVEFG